jgi:hypothetical protein
MPASDVVSIAAINYDAAAQSLAVRATSTQDDAVVLTAYTKNNGVLAELGPLAWDAANGDHRATFPGVTVAPDCVAVSSLGGGYDESALAGSCAAGPGGEPVESPLTQWLLAAGGVSASGNQVIYNGAAGQWNANSINSANFATLGFTQPFEVKFTLDTNPAGTTWIVGLGVSESQLNWRDVDYGLRSSNGQLRIYENGDYRAAGPTLAAGDVLSMYVNAGVIEYRMNGATIYTSTYSGAPNFYVDSSFKSGAMRFSVSVVSLPDTPPVDPPAGEIPVATWFGANGIADSGNNLVYSGAPQNWVATINSAPLSLLGATSAYSLSWTVGSNPSGTTWVVGLGVTESSSSWRDIDFGLRSSNGVLNVYENGDWITGGGPLTAGDELTIAVQGTLLEYRLNGVPIHARSITGSEDLYIDSSFKNGAITLENFVIRDF